MKKKMNLGKLKIESFVTSMNDYSLETVKGGIVTVHGSNCGATLNAIECGATNVQSCTGNSGGSGGQQPTIGCSNNSCAVCHVQ